MSPSHRPALLFAALGLGLAACGAGAAATQPTTTAGMSMAAPAPGPTSPPVTADAVSISNFKFGPAAVTVKVGATVTWTNTDDEAHTVFFSFDGSRSPILVNRSNTYTKTFTNPGTFVYHCTIHPFMTGTVVVTP
jgi:amicyanin